MPPSVTPIDLDKLARRLEEKSKDPPPEEVKRLLYNLFEGQQFVLEAVGRLTAELSTLAKTVQRIRERQTDSRRQLESISDEIEDTKTHDLNELRGNQKWLIRLLVASVVTGVMAFILRSVLGH